MNDFIAANGSNVLDLKKYCDVVAQDIVLPIFFESYSQKFSKLPFLKKAEFFATVNNFVSDQISEVAAIDNATPQLRTELVQALQKPWHLSEEMMQKIGNDQIYLRNEINNLALVYQCYCNAKSLPQEMSHNNWQEFRSSDFIKNIMSEIGKIVENFSKPSASFAANKEALALKSFSHELSQS